MKNMKTKIAAPLAILMLLSINTANAGWNPIKSSLKHSGYTNCFVGREIYVKKVINKRTDLKKHLEGNIVNKKIGKIKKHFKKLF